MTLAEVVTTDEMATTIAHAVPDVIDCDRAVVAIAGTSGRCARVVALHGFSSADEAAFIGSDIPFATFNDEVHYVTLDSTSSLGRAFLTSSGVVAAIVVPVAIDRATAAWLIVAVDERPERLVPSPDLEQRLRGVAAQASTALTNARLIEQIRHQALHDSLTGLPNRTLVLDRIENMLSRARRNRTSAAALYIDLDGFKDINDAHGHHAGDELLRRTADAIRGRLRRDDVLGRLGGDEFAVLLPHCDAARAILVGNDLAALIAEQRFVFDGTERGVTASIGVAPVSTADAALTAADRAMYDAKAVGGNRVRRAH